MLANSRIRAIFPGAEEAFVVGRTFTEIVHHVAGKGVYNYGGAALERFLDQRLAAHHAVNGSPSLQRMSDGSIVGIRTDVTALKAREADLEKLKTRYELILGSAGDGIVGIDARGRIRFANPAAARMLNAAPADLEGRNFGEALGAPTMPSFPLRCVQTVADEAIYLRIDGSPFTAEYILTPIREDRHFVGAVLVFRDVSLRKQYEANIADHQKILERQVAERTRELSEEIAIRTKIDQALQESQKRLLGITSSLFEGVLLVDAFGIVVFANPSAHRWLGAEVLLERLLDDVLTLEVGDRRLNYAEGPFRHVIESGEMVTDDDALFIVSNGLRLPVAFAAAPLDEIGRKRVAVISFRCIETIKVAQGEALQASRLASVGQLAAGVAHEINTPIQYVGDNLHYIQDTFADVTATLDDLRDALPSETARDIMARRNVADLLSDYPEAIKQALEGVEHVTHIVRSMKDFPTPATPPRSAPTSTPRSTAPPPSAVTSGSMSPA